MYQQYFALHRLPFTISPDPSFLYPGLQYQAGLAHLTYGMQREGGFILLTGEVGTGKTTLCRQFFQQLDDSVRVAYVLNAKLDVEDVLASICQELGIALEVGTHSPRYYIDLLYEKLLQAHSQGKQTLVVIEEAQNLSPDVLEMLRLLTNLETDTNKLLYILLVGQPELLDVLKRKDLRQLNQRVVARCHLQALSYSQTVAYIKHRLHCAGWNSEPLFSHAALWLLYRYSKGIPRLINLLADRALLGAYGQGRSKVGVSIMRAARQEVFADGSKGFGLAWLVLPVVVLAVVAGVWLGQGSTIPSIADIDFDGSQQVVAVQSIQEPEVIDVAAPLEQSVGLAEIAEPVAAYIKKEESKSELAVLSAVEHLQQVWGVPVERSYRNLCTEPLGELRCLRVADAEPRDVKEFNRPAITMLVSESGQAEQVLIRHFSDEQVEVWGLRGRELLTPTEFFASWDSSLLLLWRQPEGFTGWVRPDGRAPLTMRWLTDSLAKLDDNEEQLITGGRYSQALVEKVQALQRKHQLKADGILGEKTIMLINSLLYPSPTLKDEV